MNSDRIKSWPKEERPREKLLAEGAEKQSDANLLAVILRVGRGTFKKGEPGQSAQALAHTLLDDFRGITGVRPNVCVEAGFALRNHEKNRLIFIFQPTEAHKTVSFDLNTFRYEAFKDTGEIPEKVKPHVLAILNGAAIGS